MCLERFISGVRYVGDSGVTGKVEEGDGGGRGVEGSSVPVLPKAEKSAKRLYPLPAMRTELASGGGHDQAPAGESGTVSVKCEKPGHFPYRAGDRWKCLTCAKERE